MALTSILFAGRSLAIIDAFVDIRGEVQGGTVPLDVSISEEHGFTARTTKSPIESGGTITDHVIVDPLTLTIDGLVTDAPLRFLSGIRSLIEGGVSRSRQTFTQLRGIGNRRQPVTVVTGLERYPNMIMVGSPVTRDSTTGEALRFKAEFEQVTIVESKTVEIPADTVAENAKDTAQSKQDVGKKNAVAASPETEAKGQSWAKSVVGILF